MGSIPVAGAKNPIPLLRYRIFVILTATHLCAQRKLGSHFRPRPDVSSLNVGREKILTAGHASRCGIGFLAPSRQHIFAHSANWVRIFDQDPRREQAPALQRLCEHSAKTLLIMYRKQRSVWFSTRLVATTVLFAQVRNADQLAPR